MGKEPTELRSTGRAGPGDIAETSTQEQHIPWDNRHTCAHLQGSDPAGIGPGPPGCTEPTRNGLGSQVGAFLHAHIPKSWSLEEGLKPSTAARGTSQQVKNIPEGSNRYR